MANVIHTLAVPEDRSQMVSSTVQIVKRRPIGLHVQFVPKKPRTVLITLALIDVDDNIVDTEQYKVSDVPAAYLDDLNPFLRKAIRSLESRGDLAGGSLS